MQSRMAYVFILPAMAVFIVFILAPSLLTAVISLFDWNWLNMARSEFIGLDNYVQMLRGQTAPSFWHTMLISAIFVTAIVVLGTAISLGIALLLQHTSRLTLFARSAVFLAFVTPQVATSIAWMWMYNNRFGVLNAGLEFLGLPRIHWLGDPSYALVAIIIYTLWQGTGFTMMIFLGGLMTKSKEMSDAVKVDGANALQEFWYITLPQLRPFMIFVVIVTTIFSLQAFTQFFVMTSGGPGYSTSPLGFEIYRQAFVVRNAGYAAALAVVLFIITAVLSWLQFRVNRRLSR